MNCISRNLLSVSPSSSHRSPCAKPRRYHTQFLPLAMGGGGWNLRVSSSVSWARRISKAHSSILHIHTHTRKCGWAFLVERKLTEMPALRQENCAMNILLSAMATYHCKLPTTASANAHQKSIPESQTFFKNSRLWCLDFAGIKSNQINSNQTTYPNNHNINNITSGVQYQATTASVNNLKVFPTLRGLRSLPLHLRVSIHLHASNTYTVIVCFLELLLMRVHTLRFNPKIQKHLTPKHCWKHKSQKHSYGKQMLE